MFIFVGGNSKNSLLIIASDLDFVGVALDGLTHNFDLANFFNILSRIENNNSFFSNDKHVLHPVVPFLRQSYHVDPFKCF